MRKDHRPYYVKRAWFRFLGFYTRHFLAPQLEGLGKEPFVVKPWHVKIFGSPVTVGDYPSFLASPDRKINLTVWSADKDCKGIFIGDHVVVSPGVRIIAADSIHISNNCMLAGNVYISDADWHDTHDRMLSPGRTAPVILQENVWAGESAIISKGVTIGKNSIIGAGSVVKDSIPPNVIAAGNPAKVIRALDAEKIVTRQDTLRDFGGYKKALEKIDRRLLSGNTFFGWLKYCLFPTRNG